MLTRKDFERLALILGNGNVQGEVILNLCDWLKEQNPRFDRDKFMQRLQWYRENR